MSDFFATRSARERRRFSLSRGRLPRGLRATWSEPGQEDREPNVDLYEYLVGHEVFLVEPRGFHICTAHRDARAAVEGGAIDHGVSLPLRGPGLSDATPPSRGERQRDSLRACGGSMSDLAILFARPRGLSGDDRFELEALAAEELGIDAWSIPLDPVVNGDAARALRSLPRPAGRTWLYRGWMLDTDEYASLYEALLERDESLVVEPEAMEAASLAPLWIPALGDHTAPSRWTDDDDANVAWEVAQELGPPPWIVKDHVKSAKEDWHRACFVPAGADREDFRAICDRLVEVRGDRFSGGFVVRKYLELATLPGWMPEQRRVTDEHRLVFWEGRLVAHAPYYDVETVLPDPRQFEFLGNAIDSPFFVADVARLASGGWTVIEINDGGSAILPESMDPRELYRAIS